MCLKQLSIEPHNMLFQDASGPKKNQVIKVSTHHQPKQENGMGEYYLAANLRGKSFLFHIKRISF